MTILVKTIKPVRFEQEAFLKELTAEVESVGNDMILDLELTTATWDHQPKFEKLTQVGPKSVEVFVGTDDEIFGFVDKGTKAHKIRPKGPYPLRFRSKYKSKTVPNILSSRKGGASGDEVHAMSVNHPGGKPRNITKTMTKKWKKPYKRRMEGAMRRAAKASGHSAE